MAPRGRLPLLPLLALCSAFLAVGLLSLPDYGLTYDEIETHQASEEAWEFLTGQRSDFSSDVHLLPGYYFAFDLARAVLLQVLRPTLPGHDDADLHHLIGLLLATASIGILYVLAFLITGRARMAALTAAALALMPAFVGHSQNNPKDLPALFAFLLSFLALATSVARPRALGWLFAGLCLGLSLSSGALCAFVVPLFALWLFGRWPRFALTRWKTLVLAHVTGVACAFAFWPWLWADPVARLEEARRRIAADLQSDFVVLYRGHLYGWTEVPWHYHPVQLLATTPIPLLALCLLAPVAARAWRDGAGGRDLIWTGSVWVAVLLALDQLSPARYDGMRHLLVALPGMAMLAGAGAEWLAATVERRLAALRGPRAGRWAAWAALGGILAVLVVPLAHTHPYQSAYLNPVANALAGPRAEEWVEVEYWGGAYKEGAAWLTRHAEADAPVYVPIGEHLVAHYLGQERLAERNPSDFFDTSRPRYVMFITRSAWYPPWVRRVERSYEPVHTIRRQRATLLKIYSNHPRFRRHAAGARPWRRAPVLRESR